MMHQMSYSCTTLSHVTSANHELICIIRHTSMRPRQLQRQRRRAEQILKKQLNDYGSPTEGGQGRATTVPTVLCTYLCAYLCTYLAIYLSIHERLRRALGRWAGPRGHCVPNGTCFVFFEGMTHTRIHPPHPHTHATTHARAPTHKHRWQEYRCKRSFSRQNRRRMDHEPQNHEPR